MPRTSRRAMASRRAHLLADCRTTGTNFFISLAEDICKQKGELTSDSIYNFVKDNVWTGKWAYKDGIVHEQLLATPDTVPDPVVGKGYLHLPRPAVHGRQG